MANYPIQQVTFLSGLVPAYGAVTANGDSFFNDGKTILVVKNGSGSSVTVTIKALRTQFLDSQLGEVAFADQTYTVAASGERWIGPFKDAIYSNGGAVIVAYSSATSVTAAAISLPRPA